MRALLLAALTLLPVSVAARADTITNFNLASNLSNGYTAQGTVSIDVTDGQVQSSYFTLSQNGVMDATFTTPDYDQPLDGVFLAEFPDREDGYTYELLLPLASLLGYGGGSVCTSTHTCDGYPSGVFLPGGGDAVALDGTLTPTPEPASLIMLATGLLGGFFLARRRPVPSGEGDQPEHVGEAVTP